MNEACQKFCLGFRHLQCVFLFACCAIMFAIRASLSVAIVPMTDENRSPGYKVYGWSESIKSNLLGAFYWGYTVTQIPGGYLAEKYGAKYVLLSSTMICSALSLITPAGTSIGDWYLLFAIRVLIGACQGVIYPACHVIITKWAPIHERGTLATIAYSGTSIGVVAMMGSSGLIAQYLGWPQIFHISGAIGLIWCLGWFLFGGSSPDRCRFVSLVEREYIARCQKDACAKRRPRTPWLKMLSSAPVIALIIVDCTNQFGITLVFVQAPRYTRYVHKLTIATNSLVSALPHFVLFIFCFISCILVDLIERHGWLSTVASRKIFNTIGELGPAVALFCLSFTTGDHTIFSIFLITMCIGLNAGSFVGFLINHIDLTPNFAGTLMGMSNAISNVFAIGAQAMVGAIVIDSGDPRQWEIVFLITSAIMIFGAIIFLIWAEGEVQPWNFPETRNADITPPDTSVETDRDIESKATQITPQDRP